MKTIENLYNEVQGNDDLKKEFVTSFKEGKVEEFLKAHDCNATAADVQEFLWYCSAFSDIPSVY